MFKTFKRILVKKKKRVRPGQYIYIYIYKNFFINETWSI